MTDTPVIFLTSSKHMLEKCLKNGNIASFNICPIFSLFIFSPSIGVNISCTVDKASTKTRIFNQHINDIFRFDVLSLFH
jgi:hypothetical protein